MITYLGVVIEIFETFQYLSQELSNDTTPMYYGYIIRPDPVDSDSIQINIFPHIYIINIAQECIVHLQTKTIYRVTGGSISFTEVQIMINESFSDFNKKVNEKIINDKIENAVLLKTKVYNPHQEQDKVAGFIHEEINRFFS
jgi:hypothetical protein